MRAEFADADAEAMHCVSLINAVFAGTSGVNKAVHLCRRNKGRRGWVGEGSYDPIMPALKSLNVDQLMMEFTIPAAGDMRCLRDLPERFSIGLGCVDCRGEVIDAEETIVERVERAMEHVDKTAHRARSRLRLCAGQRGGHPDRRSLQQAPQHGGGGSLAARPLRLTDALPGLARAAGTLGDRRCPSRVSSRPGN